MSKKKNKKESKPNLVLVEPNKTDAQPTSEKTPTKERILAPPSKKQQIANMLFNDFLKKSLNITQYVENEHLIITPFFADEDVPSSEIVCYEIVSRSNPKVAIYVDESDFFACINSEVIKLDDSNLAFLAANILGFVRKYVENAA